MATKLLTQEELTAQNATRGITQSTPPTTSGTGLSIQNEPITAASLSPTTPIDVGTPPTPTTPNTGGASATITNNASNLTAPATDGAPDWLKSLLQSTTAPTANADLYRSVYGVSPEQAQTDRNAALTGVNTANADYQAATDRYNALNAQIQGLDYQQNTVIPNQTQQDAAGRGITAAGLAPITAAAQRQILLQKAPLQYQALLAQVDQANALGKVNLAKGILDQANDHLDALFTAKKDDIKSAVDTQNRNFTAIYNYLNTKEQNQVADMKAQTASNNTQATAYINDVQAAIKAAAESGDAALAGRLAKLISAPLDPTSKTFATDYAKANADLAALQGQIKPKPEKATADEISRGLPLSVLDVARYQELYPDAGVQAGDTEAQANAKVQASNSPEAKTRSMVVAAQTNGATYDTVVKEINGDATIKDKPTALAIAKEVYGVQDTATSPIETEIARLKASGILTSADIRASLAKRYTPQEITNSSIGSFIGKIGSFLFGGK